MITQIRSRGITRDLASSLLEALAQYNADAYRRDRSLRRVDHVALYMPDAIGRAVELVAADAIGRGAGVVISCGSASAAWVGWARALGVRRADATVELVDTSTPGFWHAVALVDGVRWDPAVSLRHAGEVRRHG